MARESHMTKKGVDEFYREMAREKKAEKANLQEQTTKAQANTRTAPETEVTR